MLCCVVFYFLVFYLVTVSRVCASVSWWLSRSSWPNTVPLTKKTTTQQLPKNTWVFYPIRSLWRTWRRALVIWMNEFVIYILLGHCKPFTVLYQQKKSLLLHLCIHTSCGVNLVLSVFTFEWALQSIKLSVSAQTIVQSWTKIETH